MIQSVSLHGFKSFSERTRLEFGPGISAIIGPNGSGKSNVVEALRWVAHQARARELRAGRGTELIFHGSGGKAPLGLAEVELELRLPGSGERLNLTRRIYRDGTAEQDLGGQSVRVRDIHAALRGTGLGPGGLAVIGQGEVSGVVQASGATLLGYLQEAAGLSKAVALRQETQAGLDTAERHLEAVSLLYAEREAALDRLRQAAELARASQRLQAELDLCEEALVRERQLALRRELTAAAAELRQLTGEGSSWPLQFSRLPPSSKWPARLSPRPAHATRRTGVPRLL
ncbi:AAA family ATPase [Deinococcus lacus]|uniref:AAA family ATPase n=1 Tax=Deinococcus lacus TaxID=392561 RepID=A0ABW1Y9N2_9DEIO